MNDSEVIGLFEMKPTNAAVFAGGVGSWKTSPVFKVTENGDTNPIYDP
jgi:hypothetical protein